MNFILNTLLLISVNIRIMPTTLDLSSVLSLDNLLSLIILLASRFLLALVLKRIADITIIEETKESYINCLLYDSMEEVTVSINTSPRKLLGSKFSSTEGIPSLGFVFFVQKHLCYYRRYPRYNLFSSCRNIVQSGQIVALISIMWPP